MSVRAGATVDPVAQRAIEWELMLRSGGESSFDRAQFEAWLCADPANAAAWSRLQERLGRLKGLQQASGAAVREALDEPVRSRRALLATGAGVGICTLAGLGVHQLITTYAFDADYWNSRSTAPLRARLPDGTQVLLGASARIYAGAHRPAGDIYLASGQITASRPASGHSVTLVQTRDGAVLAEASARLSIDLLTSHTVIAVERGDASIISRSGVKARMASGSAWSLSANYVRQMPETAGNIFSWVSGQLIVLDRPVEDIIETFGRYYPGIVRYPSSIRGRQVSGLFSLNQIELALRQLAEGLGLSMSLYGKLAAIATEA
jgi:transmembrane sensor